MNEFLLSLHVIAAILLVGPVTIATSLFPRYARQVVRARSEVGAASPTDAAVESQVEPQALGAAAVLHRVSRVYGRIALLVPTLGIITAISMKVIGDAWVLVSISLTLAAAVLLGAIVLPGQTALMTWLTGRTSEPPSNAFQLRATKQLAMVSGIFALLWVIVVVLMIVRPGSSAVPGSVAYH
ncbi:MAG: hypothetical protein REI11_09250 [Patulibacter sp.]|nr:hypothetical protein [Patulibacter sp.]